MDFASHRSRHGRRKCCRTPAFCTSPVPASSGRQRSDLDREAWDVSPRRLWSLPLQPLESPVPEWMLVCSGTVTVETGSAQGNRRHAEKLESRTCSLAVRCFRRTAAAVPVLRYGSLLGADPRRGHQERSGLGPRDGKGALATAGFAGGICPQQALVDTGWLDLLQRTQTA